MAKRQLAREPAACTMQTTSLVHEVFLRLAGAETIDFQNRRHFFGAAARAMRQLRVEHARNRNRVKRGGGKRPGTLAEDPAANDGDPADLLGVHEVLTKLEQTDGRKAEVVMLRYFAGMSEAETATALGVSRRTVQLDWRFARAWLHRELGKAMSNTGDQV
jgi:RNA polymerase sigma factor (TIGR02999 family)